MSGWIFCCVMSVLATVAGIAFFVLSLKAKQERSILIRQNLVYLVAFVNYFDWLSKNYAPGIIAAVLSDKDYIQYMKKNGLPEAVFSGIVEKALQKSNNDLIARTDEILEAIKQPLSAEIDALLED